MAPNQRLLLSYSACPSYSAVFCLLHLPLLLISFVLPSLFFFFPAHNFPVFCLSLVVVNVKLKQEPCTVCVQVPETPRDRALSGPRTSPAFVIPARSVLQQRQQQ